MDPNSLHEHRCSCKVRIDNNVSAHLAQVPRQDARVSCPSRFEENLSHEGNCILPQLRRRDEAGTWRMMLSETER